jgi:hypothetical protein
MTVSPGIRKELIRLCGSRRTRVSTFKPTLPTDWAPQHVVNPDTKEAFTPDGAWDFIVAKLVDGHEIEAITLDVPPGKTGYVMKIQGANNGQIYVKLQLSSGKVIGRSFHISIHPKNLS